VINTTWKKYDTKGDGHLDKDEARRFIAESLGLENPDSTDRDPTLNQFIKNMDSDGCGHISKQDMSVFIKKQMKRAEEEKKYKELKYYKEELGMDVDKHGNEIVLLREEIPFQGLHTFVTDLKQYSIIFDNTSMATVSNAFNYFEILFDLT